MTEMALARRRLLPRLGPATVAGAVLFVAGTILALAVHGGFFLLAAAGALGPTLLRESGLLSDQDEFQRQAAGRASTHSSLAGVVFATAVLAAKSWGRPFGGNREAELWLALFAVVLGARFASYAWGFWDRRKAALRILVAFGVFWLVFVVLSHESSPAELAVEAATVAAPFFVLAALSQRFPRVSGALLLALSVAGGVYFRVFAPAPRSGALALVLFLLLPLALTGVALLGVRPEPED